MSDYLYRNIAYPRAFGLCTLVYFHRGICAYMGEGLLITWINELLRYRTVYTFSFYCRDAGIFNTFLIGPIFEEEHLSRINE